MPYVRANFKTKALDIAAGAIGGNMRNWIQGSSVNFAGPGSAADPMAIQREGAGFLMGSFASQLSGAGYLLLSAFDALTSAYGQTWASNYYAAGGGGFKYIPVAFQDFSGDGVSAVVFYALSATQAMAGDDSVVVIAPKKYAISGAVTSASNISVHFVHFGFIVSIPDYYR